MTLQQQLANQKTIWNQYSTGWKKWDDFLMDMFRPVADQLINSLSLKGDEHVLDIASGTGEPGLSIGRLLPNGQVTATDLSDKMVEIANEIAEEKGIHNYQSIVSDVSAMPFQDNTFDHIVCRFGIMFFPDIEQALNEMYRVLKPGGKLSVAVWAGPEKNIFISLIGKTIMEKLGLPKPPANIPGIFRYAQPGLAAKTIGFSAFTQVEEFSVNGEANFYSAEQFWEVSADVAGPIINKLNQTSPEIIEEVGKTIIAKAENFVSEGMMRTNYEAYIITAIKA